MFELAWCNDVELQGILGNENVIVLASIALGSVVGVIAIIGGTVSGIMRSRAVEQTKREIAAYVAEGSIDPDKAVEMLNAGRGRAAVAKAMRDHFGRA